jgi:hypothetical protein
MDPPYDVLWEEYKYFDPTNEECKEWDLWVHTDDLGDSVLATLDWGAPVTGTGYDTMVLIDMVSGEEVADMMSVSSYSYTAYHCCPQWFKIRLCHYECREAVDDYYSTYQENCIIIDSVLDNDLDPSDLGLEVASYDDTGIIGTLTVIDLANGIFEYCPPHDFYGNTSFTYTLNESGACPDITATVYIEVIELYHIDIVAGWNLISVPVGGECDDPCVVCKDVILVTNCTGIMGNGTYSWDEAVALGWILPFTYGWQCEDIGGGCQMYTGDVDCLESGEGYWFYSYVDDITLLVPTDQCEDYHGTHITYLCEGWNLVGVPYPTDMFLDTDINVLYQSYAPALWPTAATNGWVLEFVYGWNTTDQNYEIINIGFGDGYLRSGQGYWMYSFVGAALKKDPSFIP